MTTYSQLRVPSSPSKASTHRCATSHAGPAWDSRRSSVIFRPERRCLRRCSAASFDELTATARELETSSSPEDALVSWLRDFVACAHNYRGVVASMMTAIEDPQSALHASCVAMRAAGARLLTLAQAKGKARTDIDGADLFALAGSLAWLSDQPSLAPRVEHLFGVLMSAILVLGGSGDAAKERRPRVRSKDRPTCDRTARTNTPAKPPKPLQHADRRID